jgi:hypothetical protein
LALFIHVQIDKQSIILDRYYEKAADLTKKRFKAEIIARKQSIHSILEARKRTEGSFPW